MSAIFGICSLFLSFRGRWDYELYLRFDLYTHKHTQWFYFSVHNMRARQTYRFTIVNLYKVIALLIYSVLFVVIA